MAQGRYFEDYIEDVVEFTERATKEKHIATLF
jgi:hypothetical protein